MIAKRMDEGKIVVPWNFSDASEAALNSALEIAGDPAQVQVIHVASPLTGPDNGVLYDSAEKRKTRELRERFREQLGQDERFRNVQLSVSYGFVAREIVQFAESHQAGLIVMTPREKKGLSQLLFGGLAEKVVRLAKCPVLNEQGESISFSGKKTRRGSTGTSPNPQTTTAV